MDILIYGIVQSVSLLLMAFGFSLVYGISRLPNFAHGALYVATGFVAWQLLRRWHLPYPAAVTLALAAAALLGVLIYQLVLKRMAGVAMVALLWLATHHTRIGLALKGIAQDERAAMTLGIDADVTGTLAVALGSAMAGLGAVLLLPLGSVVVEEGYKVLIYAVAVCVVGGLGSWIGTVTASFVLGFAQVLTVAYGKPHYQMVVMLLAIIVTLIVKPSGLFGRQSELEDRV